MNVDAVQKMQAVKDAGALRDNNDEKRKHELGFNLARISDSKLNKFQKPPTDGKHSMGGKALLSAWGCIHTVYHLIKGDKGMNPMHLSNDNVYL